MYADAKLAEIAFPEGQDHSLLPLFLLPHCPQPHVAHFFLVSLLTTFFVFLFDRTNTFYVSWFVYLAEQVNLPHMNLW